MPEALMKRRPYAADYRSNLEEPVTQPEEPASASDTSSADPDTPEEKMWKKRYGDARSHMQKLTDRVKDLEAQLTAANKKEIQLPATKEEMEAFAQRYPDITRYMRSMALQEVLSQKKELEQETEVVKENLSRITREAAEAKIRKAHPNFDELNASEEFHTWASTQSKTIQNMLFESSDPDDCIAAIDIYKAQHRQKPGPKPRSNGADTLVRTKTPTDLTEEGGGKIWKASEIGKLHPSVYAKLEDEIDKARAEGRIEYDLKS